MEAGGGLQPARCFEDELLEDELLDEKLLDEELLDDELLDDVLDVGRAHVLESTKSSPSAIVLSLASSVPASGTSALVSVAPVVDVTRTPLPL